MAGSWKKFKKLHPPPNRETTLELKAMLPSLMCRASAHTKPHTTTRKLLVTPKDRDKPEDKCGVVYNLKCQDCDAQYVRETERAMKHRLKEHSRDSSPVGHHMGYHQHKLDTDNIKLLD